MNYLLVMPKRLGSIDHFNIFPIGLAYISASLKQAGFRVFTANLEYMEGDTASNLAQLLNEHDIRVLGTGGLSRDYSKLKEVIDTARRIRPGIITMVGGGIISSDPHPAMQALEADIGVIGEGEVTVCELAAALDQGLAYDKVPGVIFKDGANGYRTTTPRKEIVDIDTIPFPDFDGFGYARWAESVGSGLVLSDRSCPFRCTFCFHPTGERYRQRSMDNIFAEIDYQVKRYRVNSIGLSSELFATSRERMVEFATRMKTYQLAWGCALRVTNLDLDMLKLMKEARCINVVFGLESADNSVLKSMRKGITVDQIEQALELTYEAGLMIEGGFIFGDINETPETVENTLSFWRKHYQKHYLNLAMISVLPGSHLYEYACENDLIPDRIQFLRDGCPLVNVSRLTAVEYQELHSLIKELRLHPHVPTDTFNLGSIAADGVCDIDWECRKCGTKSKDKVQFWFGKELRCPACGLVNFIDPFQKARHLEEPFVAALPSDQSVVLWGAGGVYYKLMHKYDLLADERFLLVDGNKAQHGFTICKKKVLSPEVIREKNIRNVVITALSRQDDIHADVRRNYPSVEQVLVPSFKVTGNEIVPALRRL